MLFFMFPIFSITLNFLQSHVLYHQYNHEYHAPRQNLEMQLQMSQLAWDKIQYSSLWFFNIIFTSHHTIFYYILPSHPCHCWLLCHQIESRDPPQIQQHIQHYRSELAIARWDTSSCYFFYSKPFHTFKFMSLPQLPSLVQFGDAPT